MGENENNFKSKADFVSSRAMNPLTSGEQPHDIFCDNTQTAATTATQLFRNPEMFAILSRKVIPEYLASQTATQLSIWSAGCSNGAEAYSLAMVAAQTLSALESGKRYSVFGTDINPERIAEGRKGVYLLPAIRSLTDEYRHILNAYALVKRSEVTISEEIKICTKLGLFDIRNRPKKHTFNYIVCNHVLQYYDTSGQIEIISNLKGALRRGGYMYLEGITDKTVAGSGIVKIAGYTKLFQAT
ncbi:MAG: hypothetical protein JXR97_08685 [Planctomycetes bacterium]|nr:hypothetical protein [Planctomycetota bacterium]